MDDDLTRWLAGPTSGTEESPLTLLIRVHAIAKSTGSEVSLRKKLAKKLGDFENALKSDTHRSRQKDVIRRAKRTTNTPGTRHTSP
jgi:hypothetical protein